MLKLIKSPTILLLLLNINFSYFLVAQSYFSHTADWYPSSNTLSISIFLLWFFLAVFVFCPSTLVLRHRLKTHSKLRVTIETVALSLINFIVIVCLLIWTDWTIIGFT